MSRLVQRVIQGSDSAFDEIVNVAAADPRLRRELRDLIRTAQPHQRLAWIDELFFNHSVGVKRRIEAMKEKDRSAAKSIRLALAKLSNEHPMGRAIGRATTSAGSAGASNITWATRRRRRP